MIVGELGDSDGEVAITDEGIMEGAGIELTDRQKKEGRGKRQMIDHSDQTLTTVICPFKRLSFDIKLNTNMLKFCFET